MDARPGAAVGIDAGVGGIADRAAAAARRRSGSGRADRRSGRRGARRSGTCLVGDVTNTFAAYEPLLDSELSAAVFRELLGFSAPDPDGARRRRARAADRRADAGRVAAACRSCRTRRIRCRRRCCRRSRAGTAGRPLSIHLGESAQEIQFLQRRDRRVARAARIARRVESVVDAARVRAGGVPGRARDGATTACSPSTGCSSRTPSLSRLRRRGRHRRRLSAQQPLDGRRGAADRPVLRVGRPRRGRHRQPRQRRGPESVRGAGGDAAPGAVGSRPRASSRAPRSRGAQALGFDSELGSSSPASARSCWRSGYPPDVADVEEYLVSGIDPADLTLARSLTPPEDTGVGSDF